MTQGFYSIKYCMLFKIYCVVSSFVCEARRTTASKVSVDPEKTVSENSESCKNHAAHWRVECASFILSLCNASATSCVSLEATLNSTTQHLHIFLPTHSFVQETGEALIMIF